ncbi:isochorismatase [Azorhizobium oxalatiphilum]|uniref:Isochorismatase n=1 Tax=Azorhizobium oxalatiphilum TaxID=980631 RepID=A0A917F589_9HYPH|nr:cysteine hydrolase [Azorhizobium oxalatiphilum]GGF51394.1 isochorismatase [Azorhizobium oxalatiphilum]
MTSTLFLVMDMLNDLVHPDGAGGKSYVPQMAARDVVGRTRAAIDKARAAGALIGYVRVGFAPDYKDCPASSPVFSKARENGLFKLGSWGTEVLEALAPEPEDFDFVKHRVSPFYGTALEPALRARGITRLILSGVSTNGVVHAGAREAHDRDYACIVLEDCCAGATAEEHDNALRSMARFVSIKASTDVDFAG